MRAPREPRTDAERLLRFLYDHDNAHSTEIQAQLGWDRRRLQDAARECRARGWLTVTPEKAGEEQETDPEDR